MFGSFEGLYTLYRPQLDGCHLARITCMVAHLLAWVLQASRSGNLGGHKEQLVVRVAGQDIQLDAHERDAMQAIPPLN